MEGSFFSDSSSFTLIHLMFYRSLKFVNSVIMLCFCTCRIIGSVTQMVDLMGTALTKL